MPYMMSHFFEGGTEAQYRAVVDVAHPGGSLPAGQTYHAAGPTEGGWLVVAVWHSKEASDTFVSETLMPALSSACRADFRVLQKNVPRRLPTSSPPNILEAKGPDPLTFSGSGSSLPSWLQ